MNRRLESANDGLTAANRELSAANERERKSTRLAQRRAEVALDAIDTYHQALTQDLTIREPRFAELRKKLLQAPLAFYQKLVTILEGEEDQNETTRREPGSGQLHPGRDYQHPGPDRGDPPVLSRGPPPLDAAGRRAARQQRCAGHTRQHLPGVREDPGRQRTDDRWGRLPGAGSRPLRRALSPPSE